MSNIKPTLTIAALAKMDGAANPAPFTFGIDSHVVVFPDPMALPVEELEQFASDLESAESFSQVFRRWLAEDDAELLLKRITGRQANVLVQAVKKHYQIFLGDAGEGSASTTA